MWVRAARDEQTAWMLYQGTGAEPYQVKLDLLTRATHCTCPSRRQPCKHSALLGRMLDEQQPMPQESPPDWVEEWIAGREKQLAKAPGVVDEAARAKRVEQREARVSNGLDELELWLRDMVQQGLIQAPSRPYSYWESAAARLVDAQASGAARMLREMGGIALSGDGWQERMVRVLARLNLVIQAWRSLDGLSEGQQADVRSAVGFTVPQDVVMGSGAVRDAWLVCGQHESFNERLATRRTWLYGQLSQRGALLLEFAMAGGNLPPALAVGSVADAELCFYPGAAPLRALVKANYGTMARPDVLPGTMTVAGCYEALAARCAANPWTDRQPALLRDVVPVRVGRQWYLRDETGAMPSHEHPHVLGLSGGRPVSVFAEWDGLRAAPLLVVKEQRFVKLPDARGGMG